MVAHICGRNVEGMLKELNLEKRLVRWIADEKKKVEDLQLGARNARIDLVLALVAAPHPMSAFANDFPT